MGILIQVHYVQWIKYILSYNYNSLAIKRISCEQGVCDNTQAIY